MSEIAEKKENLPNSVEMALLEIVKRPDIDPDRLEKFLDLQIKMEERQSKAKFFDALSSFQGECPIISKSKRVKFKSVDYNYSPLDEMAEVIKPILNKWGLSYSFNLRDSGNESLVELITTVRHRGGHSEETSYFFNRYHDDDRMNKNQKAKSSVTYAKRAALENALGIVTGDNDDDGQGLTGITEDQSKTIRFLLKELDRKEDTFLDYCAGVFGSEIKSIDQMNSKQAQESISFLQSLLEKK